MGDNTSVVEREVRFADKVKALELLGKHLGIFTDHLQIAAGVSVVIHDDIPE